MSELNEIKRPIQDNLKEFELVFEKTMHSESLLLNKIINYILKSKGKQLRPVLVLLSAGIFGKINPSTYTAATLIELLHTASLVHDDVVDDSNFRRGFFSVNALWKNKIAVLVGDYFLSKGMILALDQSEFRILKLVSDAVKEMSEGELLQLQKSRFMNISEEVYYKIIRKKTAALLAASCAAGTASVSDDEQLLLKMKKFGELLGLAFQIKDDLLDFDASNNTGKPVFNDLKEQKISLPLIVTLQKADILERRRLLSYVKKHNTNKKTLEKLIGAIKQADGFNYAIQKMEQFKTEALEILNEFPDSDCKNSLIKLVTFTTQRKF